MRDAIYSQIPLSRQEAAVLIVLVIAVAVVRGIRWYRLNSDDIRKVDSNDAFWIGSRKSTKEKDAE